MSMASWTIFPLDRGHLAMVCLVQQPGPTGFDQERQRMGGKDSDKDQEADDRAIDRYVSDRDADRLNEQSDRMAKDLGLTGGSDQDWPDSEA